jgi:prophage maintenance system killer protein
LRIPSLETVVAFNHSIREADEWFEEPDELDRVGRILDQLVDETDPVVASALSVSRLAQSQAFTEANKRTAVLVGRWILDRNGIDGAKYIPENDMELAPLLLQAARGADMSGEVISLFDSRR